MNLSYSETLITATELIQHTHDPEWRIFDCRFSLTDGRDGPRAYAEGHIPNAIYLHLDGDLSGIKTGHNGRHPLPDRRNFRNRMANCGVDINTQVVAYDDQGGMFAARLWWILRWLGHRQVAVLDGGLTAWRAASFPLEIGIPYFSPTDFISQSGETVLTADEVLAHVNQGDRLIIDARSADRYAGQNETLDPVGGHIPGAINRFFRHNLDNMGYFKTPNQLRTEFDALLHQTPANHVIHQCGSGVTACHNLLAMEIAGLTGSCLYPGSWSEWCANPHRPMVVTG
ncbi:MAG: hypothetical protein RLZZ490_1786 [Cyanobacteriota bacterium]